MRTMDVIDPTRERERKNTNGKLKPQEKKLDGIGALMHHTRSRAVRIYNIRDGPLLFLLLSSVI
jgi:hypothetical protein